MDSIEPSKGLLPKDRDGLEAITKSDTADIVKLKAYWQLYKLQSKINHTKALDYLENQLSLAKEIGNSKYEGLAHHGKGAVYRHIGQYSQAVNAILDATEVFEREEDVTRSAFNLAYIGYIFMKVGGHEAAIPYFDKALQGYQSVKNHKMTFETYVNLANTHRKKQQPDYYRAESYYIKAVDLQKQIGAINYGRLAYLYNEIGALNFQAERYAQAITAYQDALTYAGKMDTPTEMQTNLYINLAESALKLDGEYTNLANKWIGKALALSPNMADTDEQTAIKRLNTMGAYFHQTGQYEQALTQFNKAVVLANQEVVNKPLQETLSLITTTYKAMEDTGESVALASVFYYEDLKEEQNALEKELASTLNNTASPAALQKEVVLHYERKEAAVDQRLLMIAWQVVGLLTILLIVGGYFLKRYHFYLEMAEYDLNSIQKYWDENKCMN